MAKDIFWERVNELIKKNKTTQRNVAEACGINLRTFQNWMNKDLFPTVFDGYKLANFLGVTVEYLVTGQIGESRQYVKKVEKFIEKIKGQLARIK